MKVAVAGSSGFIGTALLRRLADDGHEVLRLVRRPALTAGEVSWDPRTGDLDHSGLTGVDAAVNLAGAGVGEHRWTAAYKRQIIDSRVDTTRTLATALAALDPLPRAFVVGSAVGFYGDRGEEVLTEDSSPGRGFLTDVVLAWEAAARSARNAGIRVTHARSGIVLGPGGGTLARVIPLAKRGLAGRLGNGKQWWPWITLDDEVAAITHLLTADVEGPVNLTAPEPARQGDVARAIGVALGRPHQVPAPAFGLRLVLGGLAGDVLASCRARPERLLGSGFGFAHLDVAEAMKRVIGSR
jgi:uncharacterized protein (TIGR01777 family)